MERIGVEAKGRGEEGTKVAEVGREQRLNSWSGGAEEKAEEPKAPGLAAAHPQASLSPGPPLQIFI